MFHPGKHKRYMKTLFFVVFLFRNTVSVTTSEVMYEDDLDYELLDGFYPYEKETNDTIDELIMESLKGLEGGTREDSDLLTELDMYLTKEQFHELYQASQSDNSRQKRKAVRSVARRWPGGIVPYKMARKHFRKQDEYMIQRAMTEIERYTCVTFRPAINNDKNFILFQDGDGCSSHLGMVRRGMQIINLDHRFCRYKGLYLHEIGHALGLVHEHQLPNRDEYIEIIWDNVMPGYEHNFSKYSTRLVDVLGLPYDVTSIMHYGLRSFSKDGKETIRVRNKTKNDIVGRVYRKELAYTDVYAINMMYNCSGHCPNLSKCGLDGHVDKNCNCICRDGSQNCDISHTVNKSAEFRNRNRSSWKCYVLANQGNCALNESTMLRRCARACGLCETDKPSDRCEDVEKRCPVWKERGDCITNSNWMKRNCQVTCGFCKTNESFASRYLDKCNNSIYGGNVCDRLALMGQCVINADWMSVNCAWSCRMCAEEIIVFDPLGNGDITNSTLIPIGSDELGKTTSVDTIVLENSTSVPDGSVNLENSTALPMGSGDFINATLPQ